MRPSTTRPRDGFYADRLYPRQRSDVSLKDILAAAVVVAGLIASALLAVAMLLGLVWVIAVIVGDLARRISG